MRMKPRLFAITGMVSGILAASSPGINAAEASCVNWQDKVTIQGLATVKEYPGAPSFESVEWGDTPFNAQVVRLNEPLCVHEDTSDPDGLSPELTRIREVQIIGDNASSTQGFISATGTLEIAQTGYHVVQLLLNVDAPPQERPDLAADNQHLQNDVFGLYPGMELYTASKIIEEYAPEIPLVTHYDLDSDTTQFPWYFSAGTQNYRDRQRSGRYIDQLNAFFSGPSDGSQLLGVHRVLHFPQNGAPPFEDTIAALVAKYGEYDAVTQRSNFQMYDYYWFKTNKDAVRNPNCRLSYRWANTSSWFEGQIDVSGNGLSPTQREEQRTFYGRTAQLSDCGTIVHVYVNANDRKTTLQAISYQVIDYKLTAEAIEAMAAARAVPTAAVPRL